MSLRASRLRCRQRRSRSCVIVPTFDGKRGLLDLTLYEAANAVRTGETNATVLTKASLIAFEAKQAQINAAIRIDREVALEVAEGLDKLRNAGRLLGRLHRVPLAHKDMYYQAGKPNTGGSKIGKTFVPSHTATDREIGGRWRDYCCCAEHA